MPLRFLKRQLTQSLLLADNSSPSLGGPDGPPFFMKQLLFAWPDEIDITGLSDLPSAYALYRIQKFNVAEIRLLSYLSRNPFCSDSLFLLALLKLRSFNYKSYALLIQESDSSSILDPAELLFLQVQYLLQRSEIDQLLLLVDLVKANIIHFNPLALSLSALYIHVGRLSEAKVTLDHLPSWLNDSLEAQRLVCRIYERGGEYNTSLKLISRICDRFPSHLPSRIQYLDVAIKARSQQLTLPILNSIISDFGHTTELLPHLSQIRLLQHKPAISRRVILQNGVYHSISSNQESFASNIYNCMKDLVMSTGCLIHLSW